MFFSKSGMLAKELGFTLVHDSRFNYNKNRQGRQRDTCWYREVVTEHGLSPEDLYQIWIDAWWMESKDSGSSGRIARAAQNCTATEEKEEFYLSRT